MEISDIAISILMGLVGFVLSLPIYASLAYATGLFEIVDETATIAGVSALITGIGIFCYTLKWTKRSG